MANPGIVSLAAVRLLAQRESDMVNSQFISTTEWNAFISNSYKELYDLLISAYGEDYYMAAPSTFVTDGTNQRFNLPNDFYKLMGVDLQLAANSYATIRKFNLSDRNRYAVPNFQSFYGVTNLRYRLFGSQIWLTPIPAAGQTIQIFYAPRPSSIQQNVMASTTNASATVTVDDSTYLTAGMNIVGAGIPVGATISSITNGTTIVISASATATVSNVLIECYSDATTIDGIAGWEEYVIVDAAIKAKDKEESDVSTLAARKLLMKQRLEDMAEARDAATPATVADTQYSDMGFPDGSGSGYGTGAF